LREIGEMFGPLADALGRAWSGFTDEELAVILRFVRESNAIVASENARLRGQSEQKALPEGPPLDEQQP
jgi:hypothetical protein